VIDSDVIEKRPRPLRALLGLDPVILEDVDRGQNEGAIR